MDDLVNVDGIGPKTVEKIKSDILLSDAVAADKKIDEKADKKIAEKTK